MSLKLLNLINTPAALLLHNELDNVQRPQQCAKTAAMCKDPVKNDLEIFFMFFFLLYTPCQTLFAGVFFLLVFQGKL